MAKNKERIVHDYELERPLIKPPNPVEKWWEDEPPGHGASGVGTRAARHAKKPKQRRPGRIALTLLLLLVLVVCSLMVVYLDFRRGMSAGDPNPAPSKVTSQAKLYTDLPSPDTVKRRLEKAGFEVGFLADSYDRTKHGYDVADTVINRNKAQILAFPDKQTTREFVNVAGGTGYVIVWGDLWAISLGQGEDAKPLAEDIANKLDAKFYWTPQGD